MRDVEGTVWYIPNGQINRIGNKSQEWARALLDVSVSYDTDLRRAEEIIKDVADSMWHDPEWSARASAFGAKVRDATEYLGDLGVTERPGTLRGRVTWDDPCHLLHGQKIRAQPRALLAAIPGRDRKTFLEALNGLVADRLSEPVDCSPAPRRREPQA